MIIYRNDFTAKRGLEMRSRINRFNKIENFSLSRRRVRLCQFYVDDLSNLIVGIIRNPDENMRLSLSQNSAIGKSKEI